MSVAVDVIIMSSGSASFAIALPVEIPWEMGTLQLSGGSGVRVGSQSGPHHLPAV